MPRIKLKIKKLLEKSRDSALLAVEIYNKPKAVFRSYGFIVLMHIAWTSLFHAIFEKRGVNYYYKKDKRRYEKINGERKSWELAKCIKEIYLNDITAERKNLEFFIKLRNKIEHHFVPEIDQDIYGECQSMLMNYESLLVGEFGEEFSIDENLVFALQFSKILHPEQIKLLKRKKSLDYRNIKDFVDKYRSKLKKDIVESLNYSFRVFLVPKVVSSKNSADFTLEFVKYDSSDPTEVEKYKNLIVAIKEKQVPMKGFRPTDVCKKIYKVLKNKMPHGWKFNPSYHHVKCYKYYKIRPIAGDPNPGNTKINYCFFDETFGQYGSRQEWIDFLIKKLVDKKEYDKIIK